MSLTILGIDPGTMATGYGVVVVEDHDLVYKDHGIISPSSKASLQARIEYISDGLDKIYSIHKPQHTAVEKMFFGKNASVAFKLGYVFALCLLKSKQNNSEFFEYPSRLVKKTVTFSGAASKELVRQFMQNISPMDSKPLDATDALAVAICHSRQLTPPKKVLKGLAL